MKPNSTPTPSAQDRAALRNTLLKLTAGQKILCTVVVAVVALIWYDLLNRVLVYGDGMDYAGLGALGAQAVSFLQRYNTFFWWAIIILCTLIIAYFLYGFVQTSRQRVRSKLVSAAALSDLVDQLSEPAREVLRWVWNDHRHPVTVGDLQQTAHELRTNRSGKIALSRQHSATLDG